MKLKNISKRTILMTTISAPVLFVLVLMFFLPKDTILNSSALFIKNIGTFLSQGKENVGLPARLKIPVINVDSTIIPVGLTIEGAMGVPDNPAEVAWFNLGPRPGEKGSAVVAGHYGWKNNIPAVFDNLHKLNKGDKVFVEDEKGMITIFTVREIQTYDKDEIVSDVFVSEDGKVHLNLITCTGSWNNVEKIRTERLVIFTDKE